MRVERDPDGRDDAPGHRWGRWSVYDDAGRYLGPVVEHHVWADSEWGPATYLVAHNPTGGPGAALWSSEGHETIPEAMAALEAWLSS